MTDKARREELEGEIARLRAQLANAEERLCAYDLVDDDAAAARAADARTLRWLFFGVAMICLVGATLRSCVVF